MSKAKYCKCKNTYTMKCNDRDCKTPYYWKHGVGNINRDDHVSNIDNQDTERTETHTATQKTSNSGNVNNINTERTINRNT